MEVDNLTSSGLIKMLLDEDKLDWIVVIKDAEGKVLHGVSICLEKPDVAGVLFG